jgi:phosphoribosylaminoimidazole-succinocarboxamide synthase
MKCQKLNTIHVGKAKTVYESTDQQYCIIEFRDDISAFNGSKLESLPYKGALNNSINTYFMEFLNLNGVSTHHIEQLSATEELVRKLVIIPIEVVVRNRAAGSLCKRYGIERGLTLKQPLVEWFLKSDQLGDPLITEAVIDEFELALSDDLKQMKQIALQVNDLLQQQFASIDLSLIDFKLEFGKVDGKLYLADEITPDGCRLWDTTTSEVYDKDRFRQNMGNVVQYYQVIAERLGIACDHIG